MKPTAPWSIKGIDDEAREVAKASAKAAGLTLGQYMTQIIREQADETGEAAGGGLRVVNGGAAAAPAHAHPNGGVVYATPVGHGYAASGGGSLANIGPLAAAVRDISNRLDGSETRAERSIGELKTTVETLTDRLSQVERNQAQPTASLQAIAQDVAAHLTASRKRNQEAIESTERAITEVTGRIEESISRSNDAVVTIGKAVSSMAERLNGVEETQSELLRTTRPILERLNGPSLAALAAADEAAAAVARRPASIEARGFVDGGAQGAPERADGWPSNWRAEDDAAEMASRDAPTPEADALAETFATETRETASAAGETTAELDAAIDDLEDFFDDPKTEARAETETARETGAEADIEPAKDKPRDLGAALYGGERRGILDEVARAVAESVGAFRPGARKARDEEPELEPAEDPAHGREEVMIDLSLTSQMVDETEPVRDGDDDPAFEPAAAEAEAEPKRRGFFGRRKKATLSDKHAATPLAASTAIDDDDDAPVIELTQVAPLADDIDDEVEFELGADLALAPDEDPEGWDENWDAGEDARRSPGSVIAAIRRVTGGGHAAQETRLHSQAAEPPDFLAEPSLEEWSDGAIADSSNRRLLYGAGAVFLIMAIFVYYIFIGGQPR